MRRPYLPTLACVLCVAMLVACDAPPTPLSTPLPTPPVPSPAPPPTAISSLPCPTSTPGTPVLQREIRPPVPQYPNAQHVQLATPDHLRTCWKNPQLFLTQVCPSIPRRLHALPPMTNPKR